MDQSEADIQKEILDFLDSKGFVAVKFNAGAFKVKGGKRGNPSRRSVGVSDILACSPCGRFCAFEIKKPGGEASEAQVAFQARVVASGGIALIVESKGQLIQALTLV